MACIKVFGFLMPILIQTDGTIIAGHARVEAARRLGIMKIPTICCDHLSEAQIRTFMIADNKLAENAEWDHKMLGADFQALTALNLDFDLSNTGFELSEIDILIAGISGP